MSDVTADRDINHKNQRRRGENTMQIANSYLFTSHFLGFSSVFQNVLDDHSRR